MKLIRVNMGTSKINEESLPAEYSTLGGRGLTSNMINNTLQVYREVLT